MRVPRVLYDQRVLKIILLIITFIVLSLAILNGITNLYLGIFWHSDCLLVLYSALNLIQPSFPFHKKVFLYTPALTER